MERLRVQSKKKSPVRNGGDRRNRRRVSSQGEKNGRSSRGRRQRLKRRWAGGQTRKHTQLAESM